MALNCCKHRQCFTQRNTTLPQVPVYSGAAGVLGEQAGGPDAGGSDERSRPSRDGPVLHERRCFR